MKHPLSPRRYFVRHFFPVLCLSLIFMFFLSGCAPAFSEGQSARLVEKNNLEITPNFSIVQIVDDGDADELQKQYGIICAYGIGENVNLRFRYDLITVDWDDISNGTIDADNSEFHVFSTGLKFGIIKNRLAAYLPVGLAFGESIDEPLKTAQFHPTIIHTLYVNNQLEMSQSAKVLIPLHEDGGEELIAVNFGFGLSPNLKEWVIRPEVGFLFDPGEKSYYTHFGLGLTFYN